MPPKCSHSIPPLLSEKLINPKLCPTCLINRHIKQIQECQVGIHSRGGIFESKEKVFEEREASGGREDQQGKRHRAWMRKWRCVKIVAYKDIEMLEDIVEELVSVNKTGPDKVAVDIAKSLVQTALTRWESKGEGLMEVPGVKCMGDKVQLDGDISELNDSRGNTQINQSVRTSSGTVVQQDMSLLLGRKISQTGNCEGQSTKGTLASIGDRNKHEATDAEDIPLPEGDDTDLAHGTQAPSLENTTTEMLQQADVDSEGHLRQAFQRIFSHAPPKRPLPSTPCRPIIRRRSLRHSALRSSSKSIRFSDFVIITADPSSPSPSQQPHNVHTAANKKREPRHFHRVHPSYVPSTWSSPEGCEKVQTSWFGEDWNDMDEAALETDIEGVPNEQGEVDTDVDDVLHVEQRTVLQQEDTEAPMSATAVAVHPDLQSEEKLTAMAGAWLSS
jgi:hypothetical protein